MQPFVTSDYRYQVLPGKIRYSQPSQDYLAAYELWKAVWQDFWIERAADKKLTSDSFTRQDLVCSLFYREKCVALAFLYECDFKLKTVHDDSFFQTLWPQESHHLLGHLPSHLMVGSSFTTHPEWRGGRYGFSVKTLLLGIVLSQYLQSAAQTMVGVIRNDRGMGDLSHRFGAEKMFHYFHQPSRLEVDLIAFPRERPARELADPANAYIREIFNGGGSRHV